jgi:hypothetical protein
MSVGSVLIGLQAWRKDDERGVTTAEFLCPLDIQPGEVEATRADGGAWASAMVYFGVIRQSDFAHVDTSADAGAPIQAFEGAVKDAFLAAGRFLDRRPPNVTASLRASGLSLQLFVEIRMDQDQMELELPPELLVACGRHSLGMYIISNDIPAAEVWAANQLS